MKRLTNLEHCKYLLNTQVLALRVLLQSNDVSANFVLHLSKSLKLPIREPLKANYRDFRIGFVWGFYGSDPQFNTSTITPAHASPQCDCCCQIVVTLWYTFDWECKKNFENIFCFDLQTKYIRRSSYNTI